MKAVEFVLRRGKERSAFSLIELLIVVAILSIVALIATPNFLEAHTRAKAARVDSDLRNIAIALSAYFIDWNDFPERSDEAVTVPGYMGGYRGLLRLTTPVAYLTSLPLQPFVAERRGPGFHGPITYEFASTGCSPRGPKGWAAYSCGPNLMDNTGPGIPEFPYETMETMFYDPTNGTVSRGDILQFGPIRFSDKIRLR